jgi:hypothetical protein
VAFSLGLAYSRCLCVHFTVDWRAIVVCGRYKAHCNIINKSTLNYGLCERYKRVQQYLGQVRPCLREITGECQCGFDVV